MFSFKVPRSRDPSDPGPYRSLLEEEHFPREEALPQEEALPREENGSCDEYNANHFKTDYSSVYSSVTSPSSSDRKKEEKRQKTHREILKKVILVPVASSIAVVSVVLSAFHIDLLRDDFLLYDYDYSEYDHMSEHSESESLLESGDLWFPSLSNRDPDFAGKHTFAGGAPEEYIRIVEPGGSQYVYVLMGEAWAESSENGEGSTIDPSRTDIVYDSNKNVLTLTDFTADLLDVNLMGNGFTIVLNGSSSIGQLIVWGAGYGGSVKLTGSGSLSLNSNYSANVGLYLKAEWSQTVLMIDNTVTLESYGRFAAVLVESSSVKQGISYLHPLRLHWTKRISGDFVGARYYQFRNSEGVVTEERSMTLEEVKKETGKQYYDSTLAYEDGTIVTYVYFSQSSS